MNEKITLYDSFVFQHPFTCVIAGPTGCGKTHLLLKILDKSNDLINLKPERIIYCYSIWQEAFDKFKDKVEFHKGIFDFEEVNCNMVNLMIFDDLMTESDNMTIQNLFTRGSHHLNISVFLLTQNLFNKGKFTRTINLNSQYTIIFDNPRDRSQISHLARQMFPHNSKFLVEAYNDVMRSQRGYLFLDNKNTTPEEIRIQTNITKQIRIVYKIK
jgi:hypothetical protein